MLLISLKWSLIKVVLVEKKKKTNTLARFLLLCCRVLCDLVYVVRHAKQGSAGMVTFTSAGCDCSNSTCACFANPSGYLLLKLSKLCSFSLSRVMILPERRMASVMRCWTRSHVFQLD